VGASTSVTLLADIRVGLPGMSRGYMRHMTTHVRILFQKVVESRTDLTLRSGEGDGERDANRELCRLSSVIGLAVIRQEFDASDVNRFPGLPNKSKL